MHLVNATDSHRRTGLPRARRVPLVALALAFLVWAAVPSAPAFARDDAPTVDAALAAVAAGRAVIVMRHALAPGTGDPAEFARGDCTTQRNLSEAGREQARRIGRRLRAALGTDEAEVRSSAWCRCLETGRLLGLGEVRPLPALDSFFRERDAREGRTAALRRWIERRTGRAGEGIRPAVLVTHQVNVTALTGVFPSSGELVVFGPGPGDPSGAPEVLARLAIPAR